MLSFGSVYDAMLLHEQEDLEAARDDDQENKEDALMGLGEDTKSMQVIRSGLKLRKKAECGNFWDDFISICANAPALAELLDVPPERVSGWPTIIKEAVAKVEKFDSQHSDDKKVMPTGEEEGREAFDGPISHPGGADPFGHADTRPM